LLWLRPQWLAVVAVVECTVVVVEYTVVAAGSTAVVWAAADFAVLRVAAGFAVRRLVSAALMAAKTLPGVVADDLPVAVIATGTVVEV
jgi:hypothetical protein